MSLQYDRIIKVSVGGILIEDLRIDFEVESTADSKQDTGEVTIYNLKRSTYEQIKDKGSRVIIEAGYRSIGPAVVFDGLATRIWKTRSETAFQTKIQLGDRIHSDALKGGTTEHMFAGTVLTREIAERLVRDLGVEANYDAIPEDDTRVDFRASGKTITSLDSLVAGTPGLGWQSSNNKVQFTMGATAQSDGVRITASSRSGLIGIPELEENRRLSATLLLDPRAKNGGQIVIQGSEFIEPTPYTIVGVQHSGSNWSGRFVTLIDAVPPDFDEEGDQNTAEGST